MSGLRTCKLPPNPQEYLVIERWGGEPRGYIPVPCLRAAGIAISEPLERTPEGNRYAEILFRPGQVDRLRRHRHWVDPEQWDAAQEPVARHVAPDGHVATIESGGR